MEAMRRAAPLVAKIKDREKRPEYARKLAGDLGMEVEPVQRAVRAGRGPAPAPPTPRRAGRAAAPDADSPQSLVEREALKLALQEPVLAGPMFDAVERRRRTRHPVHAAVRTAIADGRRRRGGDRRRGLDRGGPRRLRRPGRARRWSASWRWSRCASTASPTRGTSRCTLARLQLGAVDRPDRAS